MKTHLYHVAMPHGYLIALLLILLLAPVFAPGPAAADISVALSFDRREAMIGDSVRLSISVSGTRDSNARPVIAGLESFYVSTGGTSSRVQIINGTMSATVDYTYLIEPKETGTFTIGPARVTVDGNVYRSNTAILRVSKAPMSSQERGPLFLQATISDSSAYTEEQAIYTLKLFRQIRVSDLSLELPKVENLTLKKLGEPSEYRSTLNGKTYQVLELRYAVTAARKGTYGIPPARMAMTAYGQDDGTNRRFGDRSFFGDPFFSFSRGTPKTVASGPLELTIRPLPEEGRPADFSGLVGEFYMTSHLEPLTIQAGNSATLTVHLKGRGNVSRMPDLAIPAIAGVKIYEDQPEVTLGTDENGLTGSKTMKWALVPEKAGKYVVPVLSLSFFNPESNEYMVLETDRGVLSVTPGDQTPLIVTQSPDRSAPPSSVKKEVKALGHDILPIYTSVRSLTGSPAIWPTGPMAWILFIAPPLLFGLVFTGNRMRRKTDADRSAMKARKAFKTFTKTCLRDNFLSNDLAGAVRTYLNDRFGLALGALTSQEAYDILLSRGVTTDTARQMEQLLLQLESAIYTGKGEDACRMGEAFATLIKRIEKEAH